MEGEPNTPSLGVGMTLDCGPSWVGKQWRLVLGTVNRFQFTFSHVRFHCRIVRECHCKYTRSDVPTYELMRCVAVALQVLTPLQWTRLVNVQAFVCVRMPRPPAANRYVEGQLISLVSVFVVSLRVHVLQSNEFEKKAAALPLLGQPIQAIQSVH